MKEKKKGEKVNGDAGGRSMGRLRKGGVCAEKLAERREGRQQPGQTAACRCHSSAQRWEVNMEQIQWNVCVCV